jgi:hypothetical protein
LLCAWGFFGVKQPADWWKVGVVGAVGGVAFLSRVVYVVQIVAAPMRLDRDLHDELEKIRWTRGDTYALIASVLEDANHLMHIPDVQVMESSAWETAYENMLGRIHEELRPRLKDHEYYGLIQPGQEERASVSNVRSVSGTRYLLLPGFVRRMVHLMERYEVADRVPQEETTDRSSSGVVAYLDRRVRTDT